MILPNLMEKIESVQNSAALVVTVANMEGNISREVVNRIRLGVTKFAKIEQTAYLVL